MVINNKTYLLHFYNKKTHNFRKGWVEWISSTCYRCGHIYSVKFRGRNHFNSTEPHDMQ